MQNFAFSTHMALILKGRGKDARDFQRRSLSRFLASRALRYASHPTFLVANAFALRVFSGKLFDPFWAPRARLSHDSFMEVVVRMLAMLAPK